MITFHTTAYGCVREEVECSDLDEALRMANYVVEHNIAAPVKVTDANGDTVAVWEFRNLCYSVYDQEGNEIDWPDDL